MSLTNFGVIAFIFLFVLAGKECIIVYRELAVRTEKHKSEKEMYDVITEYIYEVLNIGK